MVSNISWKKVYAATLKPRQDTTKISYREEGNAIVDLSHTPICDLTGGTVSWFFKRSKFVASVPRIAICDLFEFAFSMIEQV